MPNTRAIAQLTGNETDEELMLLCSDIFTYFGRYELNVGLLLVPNDYNFVPLLRQAEAFNYLRQINIYANHYEYQQFTLLLNLKQHLDNGVILLRSDNQTVPKIGVLHHTPISSLDSLPPHSQVYSNKGLLPHTQAFGSLATTACWRNPQLLAFLK